MEIRVLQVSFVRQGQSRDVVKGMDSRFRGNDRVPGVVAVTGRLGGSSTALKGPRGWSVKATVFGSRLDL